MNNSTNKRIVTEGQYATIDCSAENYCHIEWYDNVTGEQITEEPGYTQFEVNVVVVLYQNCVEGWGTKGGGQWGAADYLLQGPALTVQHN